MENGTIREPNFLKGRSKPVLLLFMAGVLVLITAAGIEPQLSRFLDRTPPVIDVWYGPEQSFGQPVISQTWVNILGRASDPESGIQKLDYQLNDGPFVVARIGPDNRRLEKAGDFNLEIDPRGLKNGENLLTIRAENQAGQVAQTSVKLHYVAPLKDQPVLPLPYVIDWAQVKNAQDVLQIVDGRWSWDSRGIHTVETGYDRMLTIGDPRWTNYQITVPVTINGLNPGAFDSTAGGLHAGVSVDMHWIGHSDSPRKCPPPHCGWNPVGAFGKYWFKEDGVDYLGLKIREDEKEFPTLPFVQHVGDTYFFKLQVKNTPLGIQYQMKVWETGESGEPRDWMFTRIAQPGPATDGNPSSGAVALVAHWASVTFGNIRVQPAE